MRRRTSLRRSASGEMSRAGSTWAITVSYKLFSTLHYFRPPRWFKRQHTLLPCQQRVRCLQCWRPFFRNARVTNPRWQSIRDPLQIVRDQSGRRGPSCQEINGDNAPRWRQSERPNSLLRLKGKWPRGISGFFDKTRKQISALDRWRGRSKLTAKSGRKWSLER